LADSLTPKTTVSASSTQAAANFPDLPLSDRPLMASLADPYDPDNYDNRLNWESRRIGWDKREPAKDGTLIFENRDSADRERFKAVRDFDGETWPVIPGFSPGNVEIIAGAEIQTQWERRYSEIDDRPKAASWQPGFRHISIVLFGLASNVSSRIASNSTHRFRVLRQLLHT
jgi:hypothetical protein